MIPSRAGSPDAARSSLLRLSQALGCGLLLATAPAIAAPAAPPPRNALAAPPRTPHTTDYGVFNAAKGAASGFGTVGPYGQVRWVENWADLPGMPLAKRRQDWFNRLKHIEVTRDGAIWLTLSGEERLRTIFENQPLIGTAGKTDASRVLLRSQYGADLHLGTHVHAYAELLNGVAGGSNTYGYQTGTQRTRLDLQQGILEVSGHLLGARMGAIGGRQVFLDAPPSMQSARDLPNVQQTWDGFRGYALWRNTRIDLFDFLQTDKQPVGIFSDRTNFSARLYGAYSSTALPAFSFLGVKSRIFADVFFLGYLFNGAPAAIPTGRPGGTQAGTTRRDSIGTRIWGNAGPFNVSLTGVFQGGEFRPARNLTPVRDVRAYAVNGLIAYAPPTAPAKLSIGVQADLFSGGSYRNRDGAVGTFATPYFPVPTYNDITLQLTSQNLIGAGPLIEATPLPNLKLRLHVPFFWRASTDDAVYAVSKTYSWRDGLSGGYIGALPQAQAAWNFAPHWTWTHDIAGLAASRAIQRVGAKGGVFYMQTLEFKF